MKTEKAALYAIAAALAVLAVVSCAPAGSYSAREVAEAARDLRALAPAIEAGLALAVPDSPTVRALTPSSLKTTGVDNPWTYGLQTPGQVYAAEGGTTQTVRLPASGYYESTNGDQLYFTLTPDTAPSYYRVVLYTYPAIDLAVAYTVEEYLVNDAGVDPWPWGNLDLLGTPSSWISLRTVYLDGTTGARTVQWSSGTSTDRYAAFALGAPDPAQPASFEDFSYAVSATPPERRAGSETYSSHVTEQVTGKGTLVDSVQFYTETTATQHSGLTYVIKDKKRKWSDDTNIVTRMVEDTVAGTKQIRSVGEVGNKQYYIDRVDISRTAEGKIAYTSTHDVYDTAIPKGGDTAAKGYIAMDLTEDGAGLGTYTGTLEETEGKNKTVHVVTIKRDEHYRLAVKFSNKATSPRGLADGLSVPLTRQDISSLSIPIPGVLGTFEGYYEAGSLFGTITIDATGAVFDVVVAEEGIAVDDRLFEY